MRDTMAEVTWGRFRRPCSLSLHTLEMLLTLCTGVCASLRRPPGEKAPTASQHPPPDPCGRPPRTSQPLADHEWAPNVYAKAGQNDSKQNFLTEPGSDYQPTELRTKNRLIFSAIKFWGVLLGVYNQLRRVKEPWRDAQASRNQQGGGS